MKILNTYQEDKYSINYSSSYLKNFFVIKNKNLNQEVNIHYHKNYKFLDVMTYIYIIYHLSNQSSINQIILEILKNYKEHKQKNYITIQYIKKFRYIYCKMNNCYNNLSYYNNHKIDEIAIKYLYIVNQIQEKGLFFLVKYLHCSINQ
uniref:Uncharacterized protein n=1 Tax=Spyridia filamentosa TaxID=196632 RepID=A0A1Z1MJR5_SPYFI|nr:hypothetical protein [Spyridia filamentosa]ARW66307.1 hypothetical protein [Spyridia filamentosa]